MSRKELYTLVRQALQILAGQGLCSKALFGDNYVVDPAP